MLSNRTKFFLKIKARRLFLVYVVSIMCLRTNAQSWQSLGTGVDFSVYALEVDTVGDELYVGGWFTNAGGIPCNGIAKWDGTNWHSLNGGVNNGGEIRTIFYFNNEIYVGGSFDSIGGISARNIAKWDNVSWQPLGAGFNGYVMVIESFNGDIYAGGTFDSSGHQAINNIGVYDGNSWLPVGFGLDGGVFSLTSFGGNLIAGGNFNQSDTISSLGKVAQWDGISWSKIGIGFNSLVRKLYTYGSDLYVCGDFYYTVPPYIRYISRWDGTAWQAHSFPGVTGALSPGISDMIDFNGQLHITGNFTSPRYVARYIGNILDSLGLGISFAGNCFEKYRGDLIVGGYFAYAGNQVPYTSGLARWVLNPGVDEENLDKKVIYIKSYLTTQAISIQHVKQTSSFLFRLFDLQGRLITEIQSNSSEQLDLKIIPPGIYLYRIHISGYEVYSGKLLII